MISSYELKNYVEKGFKFMTIQMWFYDSNVFEKKLNDDTLFHKVLNKQNEEEVEFKNEKINKYRFLNLFNIKKN